MNGLMRNRLKSPVFRKALAAPILLVSVYFGVMDSALSETVSCGNCMIPDRMGIFGVLNYPTIRKAF